MDNTLQLSSALATILYTIITGGLLLIAVFQIRIMGKQTQILERQVAIQEQGHRFELFHKFQEFERTTAKIDMELALLWENACHARFLIEGGARMGIDPELTTFREQLRAFLAEHNGFLVSAVGEQCEVYQGLIYLDTMFRHPRTDGTLNGIEDFNGRWRSVDRPFGMMRGLLDKQLTARRPTW